MVKFTQTNRRGAAFVICRRDIVIASRVPARQWWGMEAGLKRCLAESLAEVLRGDLLDGRVGPALPGVRLMARTYGVSVPTMSKVLHALAEEGLVTHEGERRRWRVARPRPEPQMKAGRGRKQGRNHSWRLMFISSHPLASERFSGIEFFAELSDRLGANGWEVLHRALPFSSNSRPRKAWDDLLRATKPDAVVVMSGTVALAEWLATKGVRCLFIGGDAGQTGIPVLAASSPEMFRAAIQWLLERGHQSILAPFCGRTEQFVEACRTAMFEAAVAHGAGKDCIQLVETPYARPDVVLNLLRKHWPKVRPDALMFVDWREFVAAEAFLQANGIGIPRDVSVVVLSHNASMEWHIPPISHFELPARRLARMAARWVTGGSLPAGTKGKTFVPSRWVEAGSIANRRDQ